MVTYFFSLQLSVATEADVPDIAAVPRSKRCAIRDPKAWLQGREFLLTVLFGNRSDDDLITARAWRDLWKPRNGSVDPAYHAILNGIVHLVAPSSDWDRGWMLALTAILRRRAREWYYDPISHGGLFVPDVLTLQSRLQSARAVHSCNAPDTTIVAATMVRYEGRNIQEWIVWHLFAGYSHS